MSSIKVLIESTPIRISCPVEGCGYKVSGPMAATLIVKHFKEQHPDDRIENYIPIRMDLQLKKKEDDWYSGFEGIVTVKLKHYCPDDLHGLMLDMEKMVRQEAGENLVSVKRGKIKETKK